MVYLVSDLLSLPLSPSLPDTDENGSEDKKLADTLKERLKTMQNDSSSDEEEQNNDIQFAESVSSTGRKLFFFCDHGSLWLVLLLTP